jgi:NADPH2:quinone reductase
VGEVIDSKRFKKGTRLYFETDDGLGSFAECTSVDENMAVEVDGSASDAVAACLGIPGLAGWLALEWRGALRRGETVLVLGAGGLVGSIAIQAAKIMGAGRVIASNRSKAGLERALSLGADIGVELDGGDDLTKRFVEAGGGGIDLVVDPLWGSPAQAAIEALNPNGRLVQLGQSAGAEASVKSAGLRGKMASLLGYTNFGVPWDVKAEAYRKMIRLSSEGRLRVEFEEVRLADIAEAWKRQAAGPGTKLVVKP